MEESALKDHDVPEQTDDVTVISGEEEPATLGVTQVDIVQS